MGTSRLQLLRSRSSIFPEPNAIEDLFLRSLCGTTNIGSCSRSMSTWTPSRPLTRTSAGTCASYVEQRNGVELGEIKAIDIRSDCIRCDQESGRRDLAADVYASPE